MRRAGATDNNGGYGASGLVRWQAARALGMRPEQAELALQSARKIPKPRLLAGLGALQRADDHLKGGREDARTVMEFLVTELTGKEALAARG